MVRPPRWALVFLLTGAPAFSQNANEPGYEGVNVTTPGHATITTATTVTAAGDDARQTDWATLEGMVARIMQLQRQCLMGIDAYHAATDEYGRNKALGDVKIGNASVEGMLMSSTWRDIVEKMRKTEDPNTTKDVRYLSTFGSGGHLVVIDKTEDTIRAFLKEPAPPGARPISTPASAAAGSPVNGAPPSPAAEPETLESVQNKIDELGRELARTDLTKEKRQELEAERTRLVGRIAELAKGPAITANPSPAPAASPRPYGEDGLNPPGASPSPAATAPGSPGSPTGTGAGVPLVPNSYGVAPPVMTDAEIRAALDPLIDKQLAVENAKLSGGGQMNKYRQLIGNTKGAKIVSVGKPDYDHYREWLTASAELKKAINDHAKGIYDQKAAAVGAPPSTPSAPPPPPPDPIARTGGATAPASTPASAAPAAGPAATPTHTPPSK